MKLNQVIAIEKGVKSRAYAAFTELHKYSQKSDPYSGFIKTYQKKDDDGETFPDERKKVQLTGNGVLAQVTSTLTELFDIEAQKDFTNCAARADVVVGGEVLIYNAPATYLLFLEKQLSDLRSFVDFLPVLDEADDWLPDPTTGAYKTAATQTHKTKKTARVIVKYDAVIRDGQALPAQTELIHEDVVVGHWNLTKYSGALPAPRKAVLLQRIDELAKAVKTAREDANSIEVVKPAQTVGLAVFGYLFA